MRKSKKLWAGLTVLFLCLSFLAFFGCSGGSPNLFSKEGTFLGKGNGVFGDEISVALTVTQKKIMAIEVLSHAETHGFGDYAMEKMRNDMMAYQVIDVDTVSGATVSSFGFKTAIREAAEKAGGNMALLSKAIEKPKKYSNETVDVVVVGSGVAGLTAAIAVKEAQPDWHVVMIEKMGKIGGNSARASVNFGGGNWSKLHEAARVTKPAVGNETNTAQRLTRANQQYYLNYVLEGGGRALLAPTTPLSDAPAFRLADQRVPGYEFMIAMTNKATQIGVDIRINNDGFELVQPDGQGTKVTGIKIGVNPKGANSPLPPGGRSYGYTYTLTANRGIVLATGGFSLNIPMKQEYLVPGFTGNVADVKEYFADTKNSTNSEGNVGDGHIMAKNAGADLAGMTIWAANYAGIQVPGSTNSLSMASIRSRGALNFDSNGKHLLQAETDQTFHQKNTWPADGIVWMVTNQRNHINEIGNLRDYFLSGLVVMDPTLRGLAGKMGLSGTAVDNFEKSMNQIMKDARIYAAYQQSQPNSWATVVSGTALNKLTGASGTKYINGTTDPSDFGNPTYDSTRRTIGWHWGNNANVGPYFAFKNVPGVHSTSGGIKIDLGARALTADNKIIPGLYAAGCSSYTGSGIPGANNMSGATVLAPGIAGYTAAMAILGKPLFVDFDGTVGPIAGETAILE